VGNGSHGAGITLEGEALRWAERDADSRYEVAGVPLGP
jgi:hypothetical protein